jgi:hypothetical protein
LREGHPGEIGRQFLGADLQQERGHASVSTATDCIERQ